MASRGRNMSYYN